MDKADKPAEKAEKARLDNDKRVVRVRLHVIDGKDGKEIVTELESPDLQRLFNQRDFEGLADLKVQQQRAKANFDKRHNGSLPDNERIIAAGDRVRADDYTKEPPYIHAGIHLVFRTQDEIEWFCDEPINFVIEVGLDPELYLAEKNLKFNDPIPKKSLQTEANKLFTETFPKYCVNGVGVRSGLPHAVNRVKDQRYYKFSVTVLGTDITLDPHIEGHDD